MATYISPCLMPSDVRKPVGVLTALGKRTSMENHLAKVGTLKMFDNKNVHVGFSHKSNLPQFKCSSNSSLSPYQSKDPFLNLHPEVSMLRGETNNTISNPRKDTSSGMVTENLGDIPGLVNVDFADVRAIMANAGSSLMGIGTATGKTRARDAALNAIQSPLLDIGIERATGIVWNITGGSDLTLFEVNAAAEVIYDLVDPTANLIFGAVIDPSISGQVSITLIATGFKRQDESDGRPLQASQLAQGDVTGINRRPSSFTEGSTVEIPEFLKKKGRSRYPRI
ncbi:cell division protein FtsZ homolog 2-1, chloroplastic-like [Carica papaya]|uniref:cell division protein FtsZ homolog 2-1, chloroplastic-like n=1 Tax=Carica papaya TaxID=3649 RepID=UPI000B8C7387|nr:cell division protein FtsZ homolog 2-1, chloroplastic-like [Carica papaya]